MKRLVFVRHGKAEDPSGNISDYERSLTIKGKMVSRTMAGRFRERGIPLAQFISSPAFRALETALIFADEIGINPSAIKLDNNLYFHPGVSRILLVINKIPDSVDTIILFGHNPSFTDLSDLLSRDGSGFIPKAGVVSLTFQTEVWSDIKFGSGEVEFFLKPDDAA